MKVYRIADGRHRVFDAAGAMRHGGRWNSPGRPVIYASESLSCARIELLVRLPLGRLPPSHRWIEIAIPDDLSIETLAPNALPEWNAPDCIASRAFGDHWLRDQRSVAMLVPSLAAPGERNVLINPEHPDFSLLSASEERELVWDERLFRRR